MQAQDAADRCGRRIRPDRAEDGGTYEGSPSGGATYDKALRRGADAATAVWHCLHPHLCAVPKVGKLAGGNFFRFFLPASNNLPGTLVGLHFIVSAWPVVRAPRNLSELPPPTIAGAPRNLSEVVPLEMPSRLRRWPADDRRRLTRAAVLPSPMAQPPQPAPLNGVFPA